MPPPIDDEDRDRTPPIESGVVDSDRLSGNLLEAVDRLRPNVSGAAVAAAIVIHRDPAKRTMSVEQWIELLRAFDAVVYGLHPKK